MERIDRKAQIQEVALRIVAEGGIETLTLRRIAKEMGIRAPSLYRHYASKEHILVQLQRRAMASAFECMQAHRDKARDAQSNAKAQALAGLRGIFQGYLATPPHYLHLLGLSVGPRHWLSDELAMTLADDVTSMIATVTEAVQGATDAGALREGNSGERAVRLWMLLFGLGAVSKYHRLLPNQPQPIPSLFGAIDDLCIAWGADPKLLAKLG